MAQAKWFSTRILFKGGELRESAKVLLREWFLEAAGGSFGDQCWKFPGGRQNPEGYRYLIWVGNKNRMAHRLMYELFIGPIPASLIVMHKCDNPPCCNPRHLRTGTGKQNYQDMVLKGRFHSGNAEKTHCPRGHPYDESNTELYEGRRYCRECQRLHSRLYMRRKREALANGRDSGPRPEPSWAERHGCV